MKIYVASSWRNDYQQDVVRGLREMGHEVYDFKNPVPGNDGFSWKSIDPNWQSWDSKQYKQALNHELACEGYNLDYTAMEAADACVLVLPCGRSAHLEAGFFVGAERPLFILLDGKSEPELMYKMAAGLYEGLGDLLIDLQDIDDTMNEARGR
jgi:hypothetical protein